MVLAACGRALSVHAAARPDRLSASRSQASAPQPARQYPRPGGKPLVNPGEQLPSIRQPGAHCVRVGGENVRAALL